MAAKYGHNQIVELLFLKGALVYKSYTGNTPFHEAALNGHLNCLKTIFKIDPAVLDSVNKEEVFLLKLF